MVAAAETPGCSGATAASVDPAAAVATDALAATTDSLTDLAGQSICGGMH